MSPPTTFVLASPFLGVAPSHRPALSPLAPPIRSARPSPTAVLDTPASNTYLQRHAEVALRDFLTRRAVNTVMYYMHELNDGPSSEWLRKFDNFSERVKADEFCNGDTYLDKMLHARNEKGTLRVGNSRIYRTYHFTIEPNRIAKRILESRLQIAAEWARDLNCIQMENLEIQRMGFERMLCKNETELDAKRNLIFDSDPFTNESTPLRWKNYQALKTLSTRHAVARLLPYTRDRGSNHEYMYLLQFVSSHGPIANGDEFVSELMDRPLENRTNPTHVIHPRSIAMQVLELREAIAEEWISVMQYIPQEHKLMTRRILERSVNMADAPGEDVRQPGKSAGDSEASIDNDGKDEISGAN